MDRQKWATQKMKKRTRQIGKGSEKERGLGTKSDFGDICSRFLQIIQIMIGALQGRNPCTLL
jgi:hypothetical protein